MSTGIRKFRLTPVGDTGFMIATKDMLITLAKSLTEFVRENLMMTESEYTQLIESRANLSETFGPEAAKKVQESLPFPECNWTAQFTPLPDTTKDEMIWVPESTSFQSTPFDDFNDTLATNPDQENSQTQIMEDPSVLRRNTFTDERHKILIPTKRSNTVFDSCFVDKTLESDDTRVAPLLNFEDIIYNVSGLLGRAERYKSDLAEGTPFDDTTLDLGEITY